MKRKQHQMGPVYMVVYLMKMTQPSCLMLLKTPWLTSPHCSRISIELPVTTLHFCSFQSPADCFSGRTNNAVSGVPTDLDCLDSAGLQAVGSCVACVVTGQSRCPVCAMLEERLPFILAIAHTA